MDPESNVSIINHQSSIINHPIINHPIIQSCIRIRNKEKARWLNPESHVSINKPAHTSARWITNLTSASTGMHT
jgi:hypothetical protein